MTNEFHHHPDHDGFAIDNALPVGEHWFEVKNPFEDKIAKYKGLKRDMKTPAQKNAERREVRAAQKASPYVQVSLQHDRHYQKKLNAILKG